MATIRHHAHIDSPADEVWAVVSDAGAIDTWFDGIERCTFDGTSRTISMGGMEIVEEVVTSDDDLRRFQYRITGGPVVPDYHLSTIDVIEDGDGTLLIYATEVQPDDLHPIFDGVASGAAAALKTHLEGDAGR